jgi:putative photosynthetic complex assembly protein
MRGLVGDRERQAGREAPDVPFRIVSWADGRLSLQDPLTGRDLELEAFGITNEASFAALLPGRTMHASAKDMPMGLQIR